MAGRSTAIHLAVACILLACAAQADTWVAFRNTGNPPLPSYPDSLVFSLEDDVLSLNAYEIVTVGGSSSMTFALLFSGTWAACGSIVDSRLVPDPYATFIASGPGFGRVDWALGTPRGYKAQLMLGKPFEGDEAATYLSSWGQPQGYVTGTLVLSRHATFRGPDYTIYERLAHTFEVPYSGLEIPEPASLLLLASGVTLIGGILGRGERRLPSVR